MYLLCFLNKDDDDDDDDDDDRKVSTEEESVPITYSLCVA